MTNAPAYYELSYIMDINMFYNIGPRAPMLYSFVMPVITNVCNKQERFQPSLMFANEAGGASLYDRLLALPTNRVGWKVMLEVLYSRIGSWPYPKTLD